MNELIDDQSGVLIPVSQTRDWHTGDGLPGLRSAVVTADDIATTMRKVFATPVDERIHMGLQAYKR
jgi:hypothetical protein